MHGLQATVLDDDPDLAERVDPARLPAARQASFAPVAWLPADAWQPPDHPLPGYGLLLLTGVLVRRIAMARRAVAELLGAGDVLRPADEEPTTIAAETTWQVLEPARLAVLDDGWVARMAPYPEVGTALARRALDRVERLLAMAAIASERHLDLRLWMLLWHLADRHGRVHPDGVHLELPLTHELLAYLAGARRPSVSTALAHLAAQGRLRRERRTWILQGDPPAPVRSGTSLG